jgi:hypothetical protein
MTARKIAVAPLARVTSLTDRKSGGQRTACVYDGPTASFRSMDRERCDLASNSK